MKTTKLFFNLLLISFLFCNQFLVGQDPVQYGTPFSGVPDPRDVNMYQVHLRPYSASGNFAGVIARLDAIKALGINVIYLMPFYPNGTDSRSSMSPYCIKDFKAIASEYGTLTDLRALVDGAHNRGMAVIIDWVANQTSWDHPWISQHPDWYVQSGGVIQQLASFPDVAALNFNNSAMRTEMINCMRYWVFAANIDGFRCDFANNAPLDFWTQAITNLRGITTHKLLMFAEGDRLENFNAGFDFNFGDKWYYDAIKPIANGTSVAQIQTTTNTEYTYATSNQQVVRYTGNHDTETSETPIGVFKSHAGVVANFVVSACMRGVPFLTSGQEVDFNQTIPWPYTTVKINWNANAGAATDFANVLKARTNSAAIRRGTMTNYSDANVCAFTKINGTEKVVVIVNLRNATSNYLIPSALAGTYTGLISGATSTLNSGSTMSLSPFQYYILTNNTTPVAVTGVSVTPASVSVKAGLTAQLTATISPSNASNQSVTWSSSNTAVATVSATGLVTGIAAGTATITVKTADGGKTASCAVSVTPASSFTVYFYKPSSWGTAVKIYYWNTIPSGAIPTVTWPGVAMTADVNGWYKYTFTNLTSTNLIFNDGTNQTADLFRDKNGWFKDNIWYDSAPANVAVSGVVVNPSSASVVKGTTQQLTATISPSNATNKTVSWSSSNSAIATVSTTGLVTAVAAGNATITATTQDGAKTATCAVTVTNPPVTYYRIRNRWTGVYMYDNGLQLSYGTIADTDYRSHWIIENNGEGYTLFKNRSTGEYINIETQQSYTECTAVSNTYWSAQWAVEDYLGYKRFRNRWQSSQYMHIENQLGYVQHWTISSDAWSGHWALETTTKSGLLTNEFSGNSSLIMYPNPVTGRNVNINLKEKAHIIVYDLQGKQVLETNVATDQKTLKISALNKGVYLVKINLFSETLTQKLVVE